MLGYCNVRAGHYGLLLAAGTLLFLANLGGPSLWDVDEGRNAGCAHEMLESGNYLVPTFNAELRVDKPALLYWLQALAYSICGVNELGARLPSALAALLTVLLTYELARALFGARTGLVAGLIFATAPMVCGAARFANPDALLNLFTVLCMLLFWLGYARTGRCPFVAVSLAMALAVLAKGPVGIVMPALAIGLFLLWSRRLRLLWTPRLFLGLLAFAALALPWYLLVGAETKGEFLRGFLLTHNVGRFRGTMEDHAGGPLYYLLVLAVGFAPWSAFFGLALWYGPRGDRRDGPAADGYRFLWSWAATYFLFFTLSATKLPNYVLPLAAPLAILTARGLERWRRAEIAPARWVVVGALALLAMTGMLAALGLAIAGGAASAWLPRVPSFPRLLPWSLIGAVPILGALAAGWCLRRRRPDCMLASLVVSALAFVGPIAAWALAAVDAEKAPRALVEQAGAGQSGRDLRVGCYDLGHLPSLTFYCRRTMVYPEREEDVLDLLRWPVGVYLFLPEPTWQALQPKTAPGVRVVGRHHDLYHNCEVVAVANGRAVGR